MGAVTVDCHMFVNFCFELRVSPVESFSAAHVREFRFQAILIDYVQTV